MQMYADVGRRSCNPIVPTTDVAFWLVLRHVTTVAPLPRACFGSRWQCIGPWTGPWTADRCGLDCGLLWTGLWTGLWTMDCGSGCGCFFFFFSLLHWNFASARRVITTAAS